MKLTIIAILAILAAPVYAQTATIEASITVIEAVTPEKPETGDAVPVPTVPDDGSINY